MDVDIAAWLRELGLERHAQAFRDNDVDPTVLEELTEQDLCDLGVSLGHRRLLAKVIRALADGAPEAPAGGRPSVGPAAGGEAERRQLTVLFADLVGSTRLAAKLDPEDLGEVIRSFQGACAGVVARFEGHVAKYLGDGALACFGYPTAHEDDAERAVRAGLDLVEAVRLKLDEFDAAEACFQDARAIACRREARMLELQSAMRLAQFWQSREKRSDARDLLGPIYGWFTEGFDTPDLIEARTLLRELS